MNLIIFLLVFFQGLSAIKCRNNGIEHITDKGREFCECKGDFWGEQCEEEDVSRGTKLGCRYVYLNDKARFYKTLEIRKRPKSYENLIYSEVRDRNETRQSQYFSSEH